MSIIHDALKKVQQSLSPKPVEPPAPLSGTTQKGDTYLYATPPVVEIPSPAKKKNAGPNLFLKKIGSLFSLIFAFAICAGSLWYLYQQYRNDIPTIERSAKKSFYQLIHKEEIPDFKTKRPEDLKPLVKISIPQPVIAPAPAVSTAQPASVTPPPPVVTLNVHGIMSDAKGNLALINDQVYQAGDEVDGAKIIKIDLNSITVDINGEEKTIFVKN